MATGLAPRTTYHYRVRSIDPAGNTTVWPALDKPAAKFVTTALGVADYTAPQLRTGTATHATVAADGVHLAGGARTGTLVSRVLDAGQMVTWDRVSYQATGSVRLFVRTGSTATPSGSWTAWRAVRPGDRVVGSSRYTQYRAELSGPAPVLRGVGITSDAKPLNAPTETGH